LTDEEVVGITQIANDADLPGERCDNQMTEMNNTESPALAK
jgi:hypothetical protein